MIDETARRAFIIAACAPRDAWHTSGTLERANAMLAEHPEIASMDVHTAAILGDAEGVRRWIARDATNAVSTSEPFGWDALTHLCFSRYLKLDRGRSDGFVAAATALLDAGASANTGFVEREQRPTAEFESALYGAAGVAHHAGVARLLVERGADVNDGEVVYHTPETWGDNDALHVVVESGRVTPHNLAFMAARKLDWTDFEAVDWLLAHGADPNVVTKWSPLLLHALRRINAIEAFEMLLKHGADPRIADAHGASALDAAAWMGRGDVLALFERHGFVAAPEAESAFVDACARGEVDQATSLVARDASIVSRMLARDANVLTRFAGAGNTVGVRLLLDAGVPITPPQPDGEGGYSPLHIAVLHERLDTVRLLIARGSALETTNWQGSTPLDGAMRSLVDISEWSPHSSTAIAEALLAAGARPAAVARVPTGSAEGDALLARYGRTA